MDDEAPHVEQDEAKGRIRIKGPFDLRHFEQAAKELEKASSAARAASVDVSGITSLDTAGALLLHDVFGRNGKQEGSRLTHIKAEHKALLEMVGRTKIEALPQTSKTNPWVQTVVRLGKATERLKDATAEFIRFTGQAVVELGGAIRHPSRLRFGSISHHIKGIGIEALPIIALISFVISIVIAYQGQVQLKPLGAQQYTVNLIAVSVLREMGGLLTAIIIAGRSGSAFTAEIGTMKIREEVDALRTIGFRPFELLVLPRIIALIIALPLLTFFADFIGLCGGVFISQSLLHISLVQYMEQVRNAATWKDFFVGMIKSPVFALIIALVGCMHGLRVSGSAESVGKETTASVVQSIFLVLMIDGLFSVYFEQVGI